MTVEGPAPNVDHSFFLIHMNEDLRELETGINVDEFRTWMSRNPEVEFRLLNRICCTMVHFNCLHRPLETNFRAKNRYFDILPYAQNVVSAKSLSGEDQYINASYISVPIKGREKAFIAASAPLQKTLETWWDMIFTNKI